MNRGLGIILGLVGVFACACVCLSGGFYAAANVLPGYIATAGPGIFASAVPSVLPREAGTALAGISTVQSALATASVIAGRPPGTIPAGGTPSAQRTATPAPNQTPVAGTLGQPAVSGGIEITIQKVETSQKNDTFSPSQGRVFLNLQVNLKNVDRADLPLTPLLFSAQYTAPSNGTGAFTPFTQKPQLASGLVKKGETVNGWIAFEVPADAKGISVTFRPLADNSFRPIRIDLGR